MICYNNNEQAVAQKSGAIKERNEKIMRKNLGKGLAVLGLAAVLLTTQGCASDEKEEKKPVQEQTEKEKKERKDSLVNSTPAPSEITVKKIEGIKEDFMRGVDISSVVTEYDSGVSYYDFEGNKLPLEPKEGEKGFFDFLGECGINWVRVRVWNDPYDEEGHGYGGGNNDLDKAKLIGRLATDAGLRVLIDFHYSDTWADPNKCFVPKAWEDMDMEQKTKSLKEYTQESVTALLDAGVDVGMVQVGNETINGMAGENDWSRVMELMQAGCSAVREAASEKDKDILVALHFTDIQREGSYEYIAETLDGKKIDYDVFATSYYPFWHGERSNLVKVMKEIADTYHKKVLVAETSYVYTFEDGDGFDNSIEEDSAWVTFDYPATVQGQTDAVADVMQAVVDMGDAGLGVFYWEPAWIPVNVYDENAEDASDILAANKKAWEEKGSGWASSYCGSYDADDAGKWYGGSSWDNQAMFDFTGKPLESINVYKYVYSGTTEIK